MESMPIACRLSADELRCAATELLPGLIRDARAVAPAPSGLRLTFDAVEGLGARIAGVIERERRCCPFLDFVIEIPAGGETVTVVVSGPEGTREFLRTIAPGRDPEPVARASA